MFGFSMSIYAGTNTNTKNDAGAVGDSEDTDTGDIDKATQNANTVPYSEPFGFRLSFVTNTGAHIVSYDYNVKSHSGYISQGSTVQAPTTKYSKVTYLNSGMDIEFVSTTFKEGSLYDSLSTLNSKLNAYHFKSVSKSDFSSGLSHLGTIFQESNYEGNNYQADLILLIKSFGVSDKYLTEENFKNLFLVFEPLTMGKLNKVKHYGTAYEFTLLASQSKSSIDLGYNVDYKCSSTKSANCDLSSYTRLKLPCQTYLSGNISSAMSERDIQVPGFTSTTYFGNISIDYSNIKKKCDNKSYFTESYVLGKNGTGIGVVWFYEYVTVKSPTCTQIHNIAGYSSTQVGKASCDQVSDIVSNFNSKSVENGFNSITENWYKSACGCVQPITGYDCTPNYQIGTCEKSSQIKYDDVSSNETEFWNNCVYKAGEYTIGVHKTPANSTYTYKDSGLTDNNRYCEVYCTEDLKTDFQIINSNTKYNAGYHITWPTGSTVTGSRTCRVKLTESSWNTYQTELESAVKDTITNYNKYSENDARLDVLNTYEKTTESCKCKSYDRPTVTCYAITKMPEIEGGTIDTNSITLCSDIGLGAGALTGKYSSYSTVRVNKKENVEKTVSVKETNPETDPITGEEIDNPEIDNTAKVTVTQYTYYLSKCTAWYKYYKSNTNSGSYKLYSSSSYDQDKSGTLSSITKTFSYSSEICEDSYNSTRNTVSSNRNSAYNKYITAQSNASAYIQQMQKCYTWADESNKNNVYNLNPELYLSNVNTGYSIESSLSKLDSYVVEDIYQPEVECTENKDYYYSCNTSGSSCEKIETTVNNCVPKNGELSLVTATYTKTIQFSLNEGLYRYVYKENNLSVNTIPNNSNVNSYIYMPYGNIPIAYQTKDGTYDIAFTYSKLGHQNSGVTAIDKILQSVDADTYGNWACEYTITSKLIPEDPKHSGINVIYRTIDLKNPFPDIDANGRRVGSNWCYNGDCSNTNYLIRQVITENPLPSEPMYSFTLTPSVIQQIRRYNRNNSYSDFNLQCEKDTGKACVSEFLTGIIEGNLNNASFDAKAKGTCTLSTNRINKSSYFYGC